MVKGKRQVIPMDEMEQKYKRMTEPPVEKLICTLAVP